MRYDRFRIITIAAAAALGFFSFFLGISIAGALLKYEGNLYGAGYFFSRSYGLLALIIPAYLFSAAFILADPGYHPGRIYLLSSCIVPFFTLASGFALLKDFNIFSIRYPLLATAGRTGFTFIILFFLAFEFLIIFALKSLLFPLRQEEPEKKAEAGKMEGVLALPSPGEAVILREIYAESAAANPYAVHEDEGEETEVETEIEVEAETEAENENETEVEAEAESETENEDETVKEVEELAPVSVFESVPPVKSKPLPKSPAKKTSYFVPADILNQYPDGQYWIIDDATRRSAITLRETLEEFKIQAEVTGIRKGPVITMFEILPAPGVKLSRIVNLQDNIALRLAASSVRIVAPIPGKHAVGIEVPNAKRNIVSFREIIEGELGREGKKGEIPVVLGKDITGEAQTIDLTQMPHLLIAGATGSGKSVCVNAMILSILYQRHPAECRLILIDPKIVELKLYNDIPHLLTPVITEPKRAFQALQYCICEMERRYACLDSMGVRDIKSYNRRIRERNIAAEHIPYIVIVVDEFADLMATTGKELESTLARLAAMSRAVGIHLVLATQRPSIDVITGLIKANIPSRIAFMVASKMDSRIIID
ncbi:MAG: DNA translocase FtsK, partial [Treponema sp.]|nr:DNA translocase FtsK [Treponema sp.]